MKGTGENERTNEWRRMEERGKERDKLELLITGEDGDPPFGGVKSGGERGGSEARRKENRWKRRGG